MATFLTGVSGKTGSFEKAISFINISLPTAGGTKQIGKIPLRASVESEQWLNDYLAKDPANLAKILSKLTLDFKVVTAQADAGFSLD